MVASTVAGAVGGSQGMEIAGEPGLGAGTTEVDHDGAARRLPSRALSNRPLQRAKPRKSTRNLEAHGGPGLRCIIGQLFTASPLNGRSFDGRNHQHGGCLCLADRMRTCFSDRVPSSICYCL